MCQTSLIQTSCLALLKAIDDLGKLDGGIVHPHWAMFYALFNYILVPMLRVGMHSFYF